MRIETDAINSYYSHSQGNVGEISQGEKAKTHVEEEVVDISNSIDTRENQEIEVIEAIEKANKHFKLYDRRLKFSIHEKTKQIMVKVINTEDDTVVREIPSEKILDMVAKLWEMTGLFVDEKR